VGSTSSGTESAGTRVTSSAVTFNTAASRLLSSAGVLATCGLATLGSSPDPEGPAEEASSMIRGTSAPLASIRTISSSSLINSSISSCTGFIGRSRFDRGASPSPGPSSFVGSFLFVEDPASFFNASRRFL
jgi:hypothetical protein